MSEDGECELSEDNTNYKAIACEQIPELFLDKLVAKNHFSKFGKINRFILRPKRLSCTVEFESEEDAKRAYLEAGNFNGIEFTINYAEHEVAHVQNTEEWVNPEVQAELEAMSPGHMYGLTTRSYGTASQTIQKASALSRITKPTTVLPVATKTAKVIAAVRSDSPKLDVPRIDASVRNELESILRRPAFTDEDKYRVLEARDKLIRLTTVRQTDINKAVATRGTCPDMCPEKERLMREFQRQVSTFEIADEDEASPSSISHRKAIKEYSRSSADQEVPLSHELRSESVLQMTMLYLMHRIMDLCDDPQTSLGDWFHFVWDRTRSIRKDITQQELCSLGAVQLVEQCARFHIHCAARLVGEDPSVFDHKINAENLTKCLQTLKYMYHDLRIKGVQCPCEGEFRSYVILLNLGDSNFLWEVKQLPESIQKRAEIKQAIAFYNALQNNNFVRFFSMIKSSETSYLSACILLGYFTKLRVRAMEAIVKSHNWRKNDVFLPLSYLTRILGFDDESSAVSFFNHHGLQCDEMDDRVLLDRLTRPDMEYAMDRALELVESKRQVSVGECIFGQSLPPAAVFEQHEPHSSFDTNGILKIESWTADDQLRGEAAKKKAQDNQQQQQQQPQLTTQTQSINSLRKPNTNIFKIPQADTNIFKIPQASAPVSFKQQRQQQQIQQPQKSIFGSFSNNTEETRSASPGGFKSGNNIFGRTTTVTASTKSSTLASGDSIFSKPSTQIPVDSLITTPSLQSSGDSIFNKPSIPAAGDSLFKMPAFTAKVETKDNAFLNNIFKPNPEKPVATTGNIFALNTKNIFQSGDKETANIFQPRTEVDPFQKDNVFQHFQSIPELLSFGSFSNTQTYPSVEPKKTEEDELRLEMERRKLELEKEQEIKQKQLEEEKRKLKEIEEKRLREKQQLEEQKRGEIEKHKREQLRELIQHKSEKETQQLIQRITKEEVDKIAQEELLKYQTVKKASNQQTELLIAEVVQAHVYDIAHEEYALMCHDQLLLNRYFGRWLVHLRKKKEQRKLMESTPLWVTTDTRAQYAQSLEHPCQEKNLEIIKRYRLGQPCDFKQLLSMGRNALWEENPNPLNLFALVGQHLLTKRNFTPSGILQQRKYFKFVITLPADHEELLGFESFANKWLMKFIEKAQIKMGPFVHGMEHSMALCVRKITGIKPKNEQGNQLNNEADHNDGVVCFISGVEIKNHSRKRLYNLLNLSKNHKHIPLAIIAYNCVCDSKELAEKLDLDTLQDEGLIYSYKIYGCKVTKKHFSFRKMFIKAVDFITKESYSLNFNDIQALAMQNVLSFLDTSLGEEIYQRWKESTDKNPIFNKICTLPEHVKGIYHKALDHLLHIAQEDLLEMPEFPEELKEFVPQNTFSNIPLGLEFFPTKWKDLKRVETIKQFLEKLYLPEIKEKLPNTIESLELWILNYASQCIKDDDDDMTATKASYEAIENLINQLKQLELQDIELPAMLNCLNYLSILKPIIFAHINHTLKHFSQDFMEINVIYLKDDFDNYQTQPWWLNYQPLDLVTVDYNEMPTILPLAREEDNDKENKITFEDIDSIIAKAEETSRKAEDHLSALKRKQSFKTENLSNSALQLKRALDESLYKFELCKKIGQFDTSFVNDLTADIDKSIEEVMNQRQSSPMARKRKRLSLKSPGKCSDIDSVIAKAMSLIEKVESVDDRKKRDKK